MSRGGLLAVALLGGCMSLHALQVRCSQAALAPLPVVVDYAVWRGWHQAIVYSAELEKSCCWALVRLIKCLSLNGIAAAVEVRTNISFQSRLGIVILTSPLRQNDTRLLSKTVNEVTKLGLNTASHDWLIMARSEYDIKHINSVLNLTAIRFDQNIVVVYPRYKERYRSELLGLCEKNFIYRSKNTSLLIKDYFNLNTRNEHQEYRCRNDCTKRYIVWNYYRTTDRYKNVSKNIEYFKFGKQTNLLRSGITNINTSRPFKMVNASNFFLNREFTNWNEMQGDVNLAAGLHIVQYFKVRSNSTLYASYLGIWSQERSMSRVEVPYTLEERNFLGEEFIFGRSNATVDRATGVEDERPAAPVLLDDLLHFFTIRLNATSVTRYFSKLGFRTYEGVWTGLLGALMDSSVDIALEPVTAHTSRYQDMDFIFPIAETMCNIYIRHQETSAVRDIFLAPFSLRLVTCVVTVAVVASIIVVLMSRSAVKLRGETRTMSCTEGLVWSIGILCQQGGQWTPRIPAASIVLIVCLLFAVVTYNAYAAFITSVLSVRVPSVATVSDVLHSPNFKIGYIRNGADQMYLMSTKDVQLNAFYIRGYSEAENLVTTAEEGLARAARQDYAFFTGQLAARATLRTLSQARGRCALRELPVPSTRAQLALPLPMSSPYAKPILIGLLQLRSSGALSRLGAALVPAMPQCAPPGGFTSARAADVRTALILLFAGLLASLLIGTTEFCWKNRKQLRRFLSLCFKRITSI